MDHRQQEILDTLRSLFKLFVLGFYTFLMAVPGIFILFIPLPERRRAQMQLMQFWSRLLCTLFGLRIRTEGAPPPRDNGYLITSNHMSYFDIIVLGSTLPGVLISKGAVRFWPVVGQAAYMVGTLFFSRGDKQERSNLKKRAIERLKQQQNIAIFPEGTTSDGRVLKPFRWGAFDIAIKAGVPVVPVAINYEAPEIIKWERGVSFFRHIIGVGKKREIHVRVHIREAIGSQTYENAEEFAAAVWNQINSILIHFGMRSAAQLATINWDEFRLPEKPTQGELNTFMAKVTSLLVQIDSSTAVGERQVCRVLSQILQANDLSSEIIVSPLGHTNFLASKGPAPKPGATPQHVLLVTNSDVVPTSIEGWQHPPFSGAFIDGSVWGRGAIAAKGLLAVHLAAFIKANDDCPVHLLCVADEERGGQEGAKYIADNLLDRLNPQVVLGEGGIGISNLLGADKPIFLVNTAEKGSLWVRLTVDMHTSAHSAMPPRDYPLAIITAAIERATALESELLLVPVTERFLSTVSQNSAMISRIAKQALQIPIIGSQVRRPFERNPYLRAMFRNTIAVTKITGSDAENVLAQHVEAILDCRLLPGVARDDFLDKLKKAINDERVQLDVIHESKPNETASHTEENHHLDKLTKAIDEEQHDATVTPYLLPAHTALGFFRERKIPCFGIFPGLFKQETLNLIHGPNERISLGQLDLAYRVVSNFLRYYED